jgi:hypothetical protein
MIDVVMGIAVAVFVISVIAMLGDSMFPWVLDRSKRHG